MQKTVEFLDLFSKLTEMEKGKLIMDLKKPKKTVIHPPKNQKGTNP